MPVCHLTSCSRLRQGGRIYDSDNGKTCHQVSLGSQQPVLHPVSHRTAPCASDTQLHHPCRVLERRHAACSAPNKALWRGTDPFLCVSSSQMAWRPACRGDPRASRIPVCPAHVLLKPAFRIASQRRQCKCAVPAEDGGGQGQVRQMHPLVVPQVPAQPVRRARGGGGRGGRLGVPALPRRLQLQQLP